MSDPLIRTRLLVGDEAVRRLEAARVAAENQYFEEELAAVADAFGSY